MRALLTRVTSWVRALIHRNSFEDDMAEEMRLHLEARTAALVARGLPPVEAAREARLAFGSIEKHKDLARASFGLRLPDDLRADIRRALRRLAAKPAYTLFIVATIALGIGAATTVFSVVDQTVLRPPPFLYPDRLVDVLAHGGNNLGPIEILGWQTQPALFERFEAYAPQQFDLSGEGRPERVTGWNVSIGLFNMLGVAPRIGRDFADGDGRPGSERVAIISDALRQRRFAGHNDVLGRRIALNGREYMVIGVMPRRFRLLSETDDVWLPFDLRSHVADQARFGFYGIGRLARGVRVSDAQPLADRLAGRLQKLTPIPSTWNLSRIQAKHIALVDSTSRTAMLVVLGAVAFVLLITCANVTTLLLTEVPARLREMAVRSALGGSRARLMRSMLVETTVLAATGGVLGVVLAKWGVSAIVATLPNGMLWMRTTTIEVDARVLWVAFALIVLTSLGVGIVPALRGSGARPDSLLKTGDGRTATGALPGVLVIVEVAFSLVLLAGAALMTRTLVKLESINPGFDPNGLVAIEMGLSSDRYGTEAARAAFFDDLERRLARVPGIVASTVTGGVPPDLGETSFMDHFDDEARGIVHHRLVVESGSVSPEYFAITQTPIVAGRGFAPDEPRDSAIVSRAFADLLAPAGNAIGHRFKIFDRGDWQTVVGVAGNVDSRNGFNPPIHLQWYRPVTTPPAPASSAARERSAQVPVGIFHIRILLVRATDPSAAIPAIEQQVWHVDPNQPIEKAELVSDAYGEAFGRQRFVLMLMSAFSLVALILTAAGIFGLLAQAVAQRRREIGIRMALGAGRAQVLRTIAVRGMRLTLAGAAIGVAGALALTPVLKSLLYEVTPTDPGSYASVIALLMLVALAACWLPARAATKVNPAVALRVE